MSRHRATTRPLAERARDRRKADLRILSLLKAGTVTRWFAWTIALTGDYPLTLTYLDKTEVQG